MRRCVERDLLHNPLNYRVQSPCADVLDDPVRLGGDARDLEQCVGFELELHLLRLHQLGLLADEVRDGLCEDLVHVGLSEAVQLDPDWKSPLQLGEKVRRFRCVERAGRDKEDVVRVHVAVLRVDCRPLDERQEIALHALGAGVRRAHAPKVARATDLVDLVDEHDAVRLDGRDGLLLHVIHVDELFKLHLLHDRPRLGHLHALFLCRPAPATHHGEHRGRGVRLVRLHGRGVRVAIRRHVNVDLSIVELAVAQRLEPLLLRLRRVRPDHGRKEALLGKGGRLWPQPLALQLLHQLDRHLHQVADDVVHVAPVEAHLGELGRLHLDEWRLG
mmetsp:Transcript_108616/g.315907  ORF Transcript_108616/g.315907 Transcript_108616/m.315907 type:complete len:331 (-) Transcript_108616:269-1261(-)